MKRATQFDVAKLAGVSQATVSHVLNGASSPRKRVSDGARRLGRRTLARCPSCRSY